MEEGDETESEDTEGIKGEPKTTASMTVDELNSKLEEAIDNEDYEGASKLRDEIKRREQTN